VLGKEKLADYNNMRVAKTEQSSRALDSSDLKCFRCSASLCIEATEIACNRCGQTWLVKNGIPRFSGSATYWGEVSQSDAASLADEALRNGWREAVMARFRGNWDMLFSILDWQRASWLPLYPLRGDAVALDIGSGFGAITQALAHTARKVYSVEAIPERIDFTRIRLEQEGICNVQLLQSSALELPFADGIFDMIVVNGVLEWVGEWCASKSPRSLQLDFLMSLHRLLKPDGLVVIGIENRFSYEAFRGSMDHSGLPYTSLMPRFMATFCLRHARRRHYRTTLNAKREYRTYTYSEHGYRKLLDESGFQGQFYWPYPGYNQPYRITPLRNELVRDQLLTVTGEPSLWLRRGWQRWAKNAAASLGLFRLLVPDYLIVGTKKGNTRTHTLAASLNDRLQPTDILGNGSQALQGSLSTSAFGDKSVIQLVEPRAAVSRLVIKASTPMPGSPKGILDEVDRLSLAKSRLESNRKLHFVVPRQLASFTAANFQYSVESVAAGENLSRLLFRCPQSRRLDFLVQVLPKCVDAAVDIAEILRGETAVPKPLRSWWQLSPNIGSTPLLISDHYDHAWVQHGDFTVENVFVESSRATFTVVDWQHMVRGVPPFYDILSMLLSLIPAVTIEGWSGSNPPPARDKQFLTAFFIKGEWADLFKRALLSVCDRLGITQDSVWAMFLEFLVLRTNYHASRNSELAQVHARYLQLATQHEDKFLIGTGAY
jgi:SAM-dependent methyltransferase